VRRLGNSWFVKLVEPQSEPWHVACSRGQQNVSGWQDNESMEGTEVVGYVPIAECVPGLLADPAQTTELEDMREQLAGKNGYIGMLRRQRDSAEAELNRRTAERDDAWNAADAAIAERDEARAKLDQVRAVPKAEEPKAERVPCGNPDKHCGRLGGTAHCHGCRDDETPPLSGVALRDVEEADDDD
jgi:hypothetical protein